MPEYRITLNEDGLTLQDEEGTSVDLDTALGLIDRLMEAYERPACVYLMHDGDLYKIGMTAQRIEQRLAQVRYDVGWERTINWVFSLPCRTVTEARALEAQLHIAFDHRRVYGESFRLTDDDVAWITHEIHDRFDVMLKPLADTFFELLRQDKAKAEAYLQQVGRWVDAMRAQHFPE